MLFFLGDFCLNNFFLVSIDLALPLNGSLDRTSPSWSTNLLDQYIATIDAFSKYDNVLAYNVGNEVVLGNGTDSTPYIKAAARDIKAYLCVPRLIESIFWLMSLPVPPSLHLRLLAMLQLMVLRIFEIPLPIISRATLRAAILGLRPSIFMV